MNNCEFYFEPSSAYSAYDGCNKISESLVELLNYLNTMSSEVASVGGQCYTLYSSGYNTVSEFVTSFNELSEKYLGYLQSMLNDDPEFSLAFNYLFNTDGKIDGNWVDKEYQEMVESRENKTEYDGQLTSKYSEFMSIKLYCDAAEMPVKYYSLDEFKSNDPELYLEFEKYSSFIKYLEDKEGISFENTYSLKLNELYNIYRDERKKHHYDTKSYFDHCYSILDFAKANPGAYVPEGALTLNDLPPATRTKYLEWTMLNGEDVQKVIADCGFSNVHSMGDLNNAIDTVSNKINEIHEALDACRSMVDEGTAVVTLVDYILQNREGLCVDFEGIASECPVGYTYKNATGKTVFVADYASIPSSYQENPENDVKSVYFLEQFGTTQLFKDLSEKFAEDPYYAQKFKTADDGLYKRACDMQEAKKEEEAALEEELQNQINNKNTLQSLYTSIPEDAKNYYDFNMHFTFEQDYDIYSVVNSETSDNVNEQVSSLYNISSYNSIDDVGNYLFKGNEDIYRYLGADGTTWYVHVDDKDMLNSLLYSLVIGSDSLIIENGAMCFQIPDAPEGQYCYIESDDPILKDFLKWAPLMSEGEKKAYLYNYNKNGADVAYNYLDGASNMLDNRYVDMRLLEDQEYATANPGWASAKSVLLTPFEGIAAFGYSVSSLLAGENIRQSHVYSSGDTYRQTVAANIENPTWSFLYSTGMSMADSAVLLGMNFLTLGTMTPALSVSLMGSRSYVSTLNDALDRGLSDGQAVLLAFSSAAAESVGEAASVGSLLDLDNTLNSTLDVFLKNFDNPTSHSVFKVLGGAVIQGMSEGQEELCTEILNTLMDNLVSGDLSHFSLSVEEKMNKGYSMEEAIAMTSQENMEQLKMSFLGGAVSGFSNGGFFTGVNTVSNEINIKNITNNIWQNFNDSSFDVDAKNIRINLRHGDYSAAVSVVLNNSAASLADKFVAANALYNSFNNSNDLKVEQKTEIKNMLNSTLQEFLNLEVGEQARQFESLDINNQLYLYTLLDTGTFDKIFSKISDEAQMEFLHNLNNTISQNEDGVSDVKHSVDPVYGMQLTKDDFAGFYKAKIDSGFFTEQQVNNMLNNVNSKGYISSETGEYYSSLFEDAGYDIYVKTIHSSDLSSIMSEGVRCLGTSTSGYGFAPTDISDINLENTVSSVDGTYDLISTLKNANGISQGGNPIDGTLVLKIPKGSSINDILYFNESSGTYCIKPEFIDSFSAVDTNGVVSEPVFNNGNDGVLDLDEKVSTDSVLDITEDSDVAWYEDEQVFENDDEVYEGGVKPHIGVQFFGGNLNNNSSDYFYNNIDHINRMAQQGEFYTFDIQSFDDIPSDFWSKIDEPSLLYFRKDGKIYTFDDARAMSQIVNNNIESAKNALLNGIRAMDNKYSRTIGLQSLGEYIRTGNLSLISSAGGFRQTVSNLDLDTLTTCYNTILYEQNNLSLNDLDSSFVFDLLKNDIVSADFDSFRSKVNSLTDDKYIDLLSFVVSKKDGMDQQIEQLYYNLIDDISIERFSLAVNNGLIKFANGYYTDFPIGAGNGQIIKLSAVLKLLCDEGRCKRILDSENVTYSSFYIEAIKNFDAELSAMDVSLNFSSESQQKLYEYANLSLDERHIYLTKNSSLQHLLSVFCDSSYVESFVWYTAEYMTDEQFVSLFELIDSHNDIDKNFEYRSVINNLSFRRISWLMDNGYISLDSDILNVGDHKSVYIHSILNKLSDDDFSANFSNALSSGKEILPGYTNKEFLTGVIQLSSMFKERGYDVFRTSIPGELYSILSYIGNLSTQSEISAFLDKICLDVSQFSIVSNSSLYSGEFETIGSNQGSIAAAMFSDDIKLQKDLIAQVKTKFPGMSKKMILEFLKGIDMSPVIDYDVGKFVIFGTDGICNYADVSNAIFEKYLGKEELFEQEFGFPMFRNNKLNDTQLLLDMFLDISGDKLLRKENDSFWNKDDNYSFTGYGYQNLTNPGLSPVKYRAEHIIKYLINHGFNITSDDVVQKQIFNSGHNANVSTIYTANSILQHVNVSLENHNEHVSISGYNGLNLYTSDGKLYTTLNGGHIMSIYGIDSNGNLLVDSWGEKLVINLKETIENGIEFSINSMTINLGTEYDAFENQISISTTEELVVSLKQLSDDGNVAELKQYLLAMNDKQIMSVLNEIKTNNFGDLFQVYSDIINNLSFEQFCKAIDNSLILFQFGYRSDINYEIGYGKLMSMQYVLSILKSDSECGAFLDAYKQGKQYTAQYTNDEILTGLSVFLTDLGNTNDLTISLPGANQNSFVELLNGNFDRGGKSINDEFAMLVERFNRLTPERIIDRLNWSIVNNDSLTLKRFCAAMTNDQLLAVMTKLKSENSLENDILSSKIAASMSLDRLVLLINNGLVKFTNGYYSDMEISAGNEKTISMQSLLGILIDENMCSDYIDSLRNKTKYFKEYSNAEILIGFLNLQNEMDYFNKDMLYTSKLRRVFNEIKNNQLITESQIINYYESDYRDLSLWYPNGVIQAASIDGRDIVDIDIQEVMKIISSDDMYNSFLNRSLHLKQRNYFQYKAAINLIRMKIDSNGNLCGLNDQQINRIYQISDDYRKVISNMESELQKNNEIIQNVEYECIVIDGINYYVVKNINTLKQSVTVDVVKQIISTLPDSVRKSITQVVINDFQNPADPYWKIAYDNPNHVSAATGGNGSINIYTPTSSSSMSDLYQIICHEAGHCLDSSFSEISETQGWNDAIKQDGQYVSGYAMSSLAEDFAESVAAYLTDANFTSNFPNRARILAQYLGEADFSKIQYNNDFVSSIISDNGNFSMENLVDYLIKDYEVGVYDPRNYLDTMSDAQIVDLLGVLSKKKEVFPSNEIDAIYRNVLNSLSLNEFMFALSNGVIRFDSGYVTNMNFVVGSDRHISMGELLAILSNDETCAQFLDAYKNGRQCFMHYSNQDILSGLSSLDYELSKIDVSLNLVTDNQKQIYDLSLEH